MEWPENGWVSGSSNVQHQDCRKAGGQLVVVRLTAIPCLSDFFAFQLSTVTLVFQTGLCCRVDCNKIQAIRQASDSIGNPVGGQWTNYFS